MCCCCRAATNSTSVVFAWAARAGLSRDQVIGLAVGLVGGFGVVLLVAVVAWTVMQHRRYSVRAGQSFITVTAGACSCMPGHCKAVSAWECMHASSDDQVW
jgi:hypothetical protein